MQTTIGAAKPAAWARSAFSCTRVRAEISEHSCLGKLSRDTGYKRVPEPLERATGVIWASLMGTVYLNDQRTHHPHG